MHNLTHIIVKRHDAHVAEIAQLEGHIVGEKTIPRGNVPYNNIFGIQVADGYSKFRNSLSNMMKRRLPGFEVIRQ